MHYHDRMTYTINGYRGLTGVAFSSKATAPATIRRVQAMILDEGADRVVVYRGGVVVADVNEALHWQQPNTDKRLAAALERGQ